MARSVIRDRGLSVVVDTTEVAEWDIAGYRVSDAALERIASRLAAVTHSPEDRVVGDVRVRELEGMDVIFTLSREPRLIVVTIGGVRPPDAEKPTEAILKALGTIATLEGSSGIMRRPVMTDDTTVLSREEYLGLDDAERMKVRLRGMKRAIDASAEAMRRHGLSQDISHVYAIHPSHQEMASGDGGFGESAGEYESDAASKAREE